MAASKRNIRISSVPSILGLRPTGVEYLGVSLLHQDLAGLLNAEIPVTHVPALNHLYNHQRDPETQCLNPVALGRFTQNLSRLFAGQLNDNTFQLVLGGDCTILLGITHALKGKGRYGLVYLDAHADFYLPDESTTGEVADMNLGIVTGSGPDVLSNIHNLRPYIRIEDVIHIAQRDQDEAKCYGSQDIKNSGAACFDLDLIRSEGLSRVTDAVVEKMTAANVDGFWIHFDTDVISDDENPAVDYRLPGGLSFEETESVIRALIGTGKVIGMTVTIFNPKLDPDNHIAKQLTACLANALNY